MSCRCFIRLTGVVSAGALLLACGEKFDDTGPDGGAGGATAPACSPGNIDELIDDFEDGDFDPWWSGGGHGVAETDGELRIQLSSSGEDGTGAIASLRTYDLRGCQITVEITDAPSADVPANFSFSVGESGESSVSITANQGIILFRISVDGEEVSRHNGSFSLETDRFWRIREEAGTVYLDTSRDAVQWTPGHQDASPSYVDDVGVGFWAGSYEPHPNPGRVALDNVNLLP